MHLSPTCILSTERSKEKHIAQYDVHVFYNNDEVFLLQFVH